MTDTQRIIARWIFDLNVRIERAQLKAELIGLDPAEQEQLKHEADELLRLCTVLDALRETEAA